MTSWRGQSTRGLSFAPVGKSKDTAFFGPELPGAPLSPDNEPKDASVQIRRQAARFHVYAILRLGKVRELTVAEAHIAWRVERANL